MGNIIKNIILILTAVFVLLSVFACNGGENLSSETAKPSTSSSENTFSEPSDHTETGSDATESRATSSVKTSDIGSTDSESKNTSGQTSQKSSSPTGSAQSNAPASATSKSTAVNTETAPETADPKDDRPLRKFTLDLENDMGSAYILDKNGNRMESMTGMYHALDLVTVVAVEDPAKGISFDGWYIEDDFINRSIAYTFFMPDEDYSLTAHFAFD